MLGLDQYADQAHRILSVLEAKAERRYLGGHKSSLEARAPCSIEAKPSLIDLRSNDYLALGRNPEFNAAAHLAMQDWPVGAGASRLLSGESDIFAHTETRFARFKGTETSLLLSSGFAANAATIAALARAFPHASFYSDEFNHASIIDGLRASKISSAAKIIFRHNDTDDLIKRLHQDSSPFKIILCESAYSMQGDLAPLTHLQQIAADYNALLVVDEAHSLGLFGNRGCGLVSNPNIVTTNPCGKAMAAQGAFVCGPGWIKDLIVNFGRAFIYSTATSPCIAAALNVSVDWVSQADDARSRLQNIVKLCRDALNLDLNASQYSPILYLATDTINEAVLYANRFAENDVAVSLIRPPTAPKPGLRLCLHAELKDAEVQKLVTLLKQVNSHAH